MGNQLGELLEAGEATASQEPMDSLQMASR
jgi:hypothetical protein